MSKAKDDKQLPHRKPVEPQPVAGAGIKRSREMATEEHELALLETGMYFADKSQASAEAGMPAPAGQKKSAAMPEKGGGFNPYDSGGSGTAFRPRATPPAKPSAEQPKRRSLQSIVADRLAKLTGR